MRYTLCTWSSNVSTHGASGGNAGATITGAAVAAPSLAAALVALVIGDVAEEEEEEEEEEEAAAAARAAPCGGCAAVGWRREAWGVAQAAARLRWLHARVRIKAMWPCSSASAKSQSGNSYAGMKKHARTASGHNKPSCGNVLVQCSGVVHRLSWGFGRNKPRQRE